VFLPHIHIPFSKIHEHIDFIKKCSLNLEIYFSAAVLDSLSEDDVSLLKKWLDYGPSLSLHAPFMDLSPGAVDTNVREVTMSRFNQMLGLSEILKPLAIVFHSGYEKWKYALNIDTWLEKSLMTWRPLNERARDIGVKIAIENIFEDDPTNLKLLMENMNSDGFGVCFDTGHCNLFSNVSLDKWMDALNPFILELHLHDNDTKSDQHLAIGKGTFDFDGFFELLENKNCIYTIEAHSPESVSESIECFRQFQSKIRA
jgi:sugar phosphate isomerase/epimerase